VGLGLGLNPSGLNLACLLLGLGLRLGLWLGVSLGIRGLTVGSGLTLCAGIIL
jgi:hypothetical protein